MLKSPRSAASPGPESPIKMSRGPPKSVRWESERARWGDRTGYPGRGGEPAPGRDVPPNSLLVDHFRVREEYVGEAQLPHIAHAHRVKDTVQVIDLMLHDPAVKSGDLALDRPPIRVEPRIT